jgi:hypothetical protein
MVMRPCTSYGPKNLGVLAFGIKPQCDARQADLSKMLTSIGRK